ncbi:adenosine 3'-phospho 5'-phosphosulfate transporter 2-like [Xenia sp. Carnegie-2017]|uniref:adenosine 3'-phospho 5'-phosphosulfate transporter 2-like n=1 Tax=Xenia sp. Carnegie-2017 TaxID=2897299 RepID=UPI001F03DC30|nr:adenosine 3'-phospho 5'-phosphosulfate transporter 2-like [Xenia sp. Carnegie-2017]
MFGNLGNVPKSRSDIELTSIKVGNSAGNGNKSPLNTPNISSKKEVVILGYSLDHLSRGTQLTICVSGVFFFYLVYGYVQELIFSLEGFQSFGWYLTLVQFACYGVFGIAESRWRREYERKIPLQTYILLAFLTVSTMGLSNTSLGYLNYPTQVIFKCCKLIPVMFGGILIQGKYYGVLDFTACIFMSIGLILFTLADSQISPKFDQTGVLLISLALCADAMIGNVQEKTMKKYSSTNTEVILYSYGIGFFYIFAGLAVSGGLREPFKFCAQNLTHTYGLAIVFSFTGYLGIAFVLSLVKSFGALLAVTVTTCRKAITIVLSFLFFTKPFTFRYVWSGGIVLLGIALNVYSKNKVKADAILWKYWTQFRSGGRSLSQQI